MNNTVNTLIKRQYWQPGKPYRSIKSLMQIEPIAGLYVFHHSVIDAKSFPLNINGISCFFSL
jgi:hypothetical protein